MIKGKLLQLSILLLLLAGFLFTSSSAFAFWRQVTVSREVEVVTIGEPVDLLVNDLNDNIESLRLVPNGFAVSVGEVDNVTLQYSIGVSRELLNSVDLYINANTILIGEDDTYSNLIHINIMNQGQNAVLDLFNDTITITINVTLDEPIDEQEAIEKGYSLSRVNVQDSKLAYDSIKGKNISFILSFELQNKQTIE